MNVLIFALVLVFIAANVYTEYKARNQKCWWRDPISDYLVRVDAHEVQDVGFVGLAVAVVLLGATQAHGAAWPWLMYVCAGGIVGLLAAAFVNAAQGGQTVWEKVHIAFSGVAFVAALVAELIALWDTSGVWLPILGVTNCVLFARFAPNAGALEEKTFTAIIVAGLIVLAGIPL